MACITIFVLRTVFVAFFALNALNNLRDLESFHPALHKSYQTFEKTFTERTGLKFPDQLIASNLHQHSEMIATGLAWTQLGLAVASVLICSWFIGLVGFVYLIKSIVQLNAAKFNLKTPLTEFEPLLLAFGLFAASLVMCCSKSRACNREGRAKFNNLNDSTTSKSTEDNKQKRRH